MANEIAYELGTSGQTVYAVVRNAAGEAWNGAAFVAYTTIRGTFTIAMTEVDSTGFYGPINLPGSGAGRWWQIYLQAGGSPSHTDDVRLATGYSDNAATPSDVNAARDSVLNAVEELDASTGVIVPVNQTPVPPQRTWVLKATSNGLVGEVPLYRTVGENQVFAVDFRDDLAANGRLVSLDEFEIVSGDEEGLEISEEETERGVDRSQAKNKIRIVTAGRYELNCKVTFDDSDTRPHLQRIEADRMLR